MSSVAKSGLFDFSDRVQLASMNQRLVRSQVLNANIANAETPGYRAIGYDFEKQIQEVADQDSGLGMRTTNSNHLRHQYANAQGDIKPDVYVRPTESIPEDGNTVDIDREMADMASNQIQYRTAVELLNRKLGLLRYAISGGR